MKEFFELLSHNDILVGLATLGGLIGLAIIVWQAAKIIWRTGLSVATVGWPAAQRRLGYRRAILAHRCADSTSYFLAVILEDILIRLLLSLSLVTQMATDYMITAPVAKSKAYEISGVILNITTGSALMVLILTFLLKFLVLSMYVRKIIRRDKAREKGNGVVWRKQPKRKRNKA